MTYKNFKEVMVDDNGYKKKQVNKFIIRVALFCLLISLSIMLVTIATLSVNIAGFVIVCGGLSFIWVLDYAAEDKANMEKAIKFSKFWWLSIILVVGVFITLKAFYFI